MIAWLIVALAVLAAAFFSLAELSIVSMSRLRLRHWVRETMGGPAGAPEDAVERPLRLLSPILVGHVLAVTAAAMPAAVALSGGGRGPLAAALLACALLVPPLHLLVETLPRAIARRRAHQLFPVVSVILRACAWLFRPLAWTADRVSAAVARGSPGAGRRGLESILVESARTGVVQAAEVEIISGVLEFGRTPVRVVMTPVERMVTAPAGASARDVTAVVRRTGYSRIPLVDDARVVGMIHVFDLFRLAPDERPRPRRIVRARPDTPCDALLVAMKRRRCHLAVVEEGGRPVGLVSMEDLVEELVGEIRDEHDARAERLAAIEGVVVDGHRPIAEIRAEHGIDLPDEGAETVAGYVIARLGRIPRAGESLEGGGWTIDVLDATPRRVRRVRFRRARPDGANGPAR